MRAVKKYKKLTYKDRQTLEEKLKEGESVVNIANIIGTSTQMIYYELNSRTKKNEDGKIDFKNYNALQAQLSL